MRKGFRFASFLLALCMLCALLGGCMGANVTAPQPTEATPQATSEPSAAPEQTLDEDGSYTSKDDVALYIHSYGHLPPNFVTKDEARAPQAGAADRLRNTCPECASAATGSGTARVCCPTRRGAAGRNAT